MTTPAAALVRVSTDRQASTGRYGVHAQLRAIHEYARRAGLSITGEYVDTITGTTEERPNLELLYQQASEYQAVIVYDSDRIGRDVEVNYAILRRLMDLGLAVHATDRGRVKRDLLFAVQSAMSEDWLERHKRRTHGGMLAKARAGKPPRPVNAYGYKTGRIQPELVPIVHRIFTQLEQDGLPTVARRLNQEGVPTPIVRGRQGAAWRPSTLRAIVSNPAYKGEPEFGRAIRCYVCDRTEYNHPTNQPEPVCCGERMTRERVTTTCEPIVTPEQWERTNASIKRRLIHRQRRGSRHHIFPLTGRIRCHECGGAMGGQADKHPTYYCVTRRRGSITGRTCEHRTYHNAELVHGVVRELLRDWAHSRTNEELAMALRIPEPAPPVTLGARDRLEAEKARWKAFISTGALPMSEIAEEIRRIETELRALPSATPPRAAGARSVREARRALLGAVELPLSEALGVADAVVIVRADGVIDLRLL